MMVNLRSQNGKIIVKDGKVGIEQACCCGGECSCDSPPACIEIEYESATLTLTPGVFSTYGYSATSHVVPYVDSDELRALEHIIATDAATLCCQIGQVEDESGITNGISAKQVYARLLCVTDYEYAYDENGNCPDPPDCFQGFVLSGTRWIVELYTWSGCATGMRECYINEENEEVCDDVPLTCDHPEWMYPVLCHSSRTCKYYFECNSSGQPTGSAILFSQFLDVDKSISAESACLQEPDEDGFGGGCLRDCFYDTSCPTEANILSNCNELP